jgi:hypothetical protein
MSSPLLPLSLHDFFRELPVKAARLAQFLEARDVTWQGLEERHSLKEWQKTLISLTLLSKKLKVGTRGQHTARDPSPARRL